MTLRALATYIWLMQVTQRLAKFQALNKRTNIFTTILYTFDVLMSLSLHYLYKTKKKKIKFNFIFLPSIMLKLYKILLFYRDTCDYLLNKKSNFIIINYCFSIKIKFKCNYTVLNCTYKHFEQKKLRFIANVHILI